MEIDAPTETIPDRAQLAAALRELEHAKARVERDARQVADETRKKLVSQLLPVMDNLDRTIKAATENGESPAVVEGITLVKGQLETVLRGYGVERIDAAGATFDPAIHEAVTTLPVVTTEAHNQIVDQLAPGYRFGAQLLRPAQVVVGKLSQVPQPPQPEPVVEEPAAPPAVEARRPAPPVESDPRGQSTRAPQLDRYGRRVTAPQVEHQPDEQELRARSTRQPQLDLYGRPVRPQPQRYVDQYGRPVDQYGRLLGQQFDAYGRPVQLDAYGRPLARRFR